MTVVMEARDIRRHYSLGRGPFMPRHTVKAVDGVSFSLEAGKTLAVVGESGCGKSSLARVLAMLEPPTAGALLIDGRPTHDISRARQSELRRAVQMVFQNPYGSLNPRSTVGRILEEPLTINTALSAGERKTAGRDMLAKVGLRPDQYGRYPHMFSGGQRQRIAIARALMLRPRVVIADEPVSALDVSIQGQILNLLMDLQDEFKLAYLFVSHDLGVVHHLADEVMVMYLGRPVEHGPVERVFESPRHPYTRALLMSRPKVKVGGRGERQVLTGELPSPLNPPPGCAFHKRCPHATERCTVERPEPRLVAGRSVSCHHAEVLPEAAA
ncbi:MAG: dipeptide ABC transporter ATP-binding protein [Proteobacteria bacterium]|nr:dipeptide ABC transporter ATP-binding protein [Pseudomonadota bacterium]MBI3497022.1 dipeptide ABC transporter ATP-binding protein [Pseudomonadota bacterium]